MTFARFYRHFLRVYGVFHQYWLWLWLAGTVGTLTVSQFKLGDRWMLAVCLATIYPAIVGWFGFNGLGLMLKIYSRSRRVADSGNIAAWTIILTLSIVAIGFTGSALWLAFSLISKLAG